jgi:hypothetical protein
MTTLTIIDHAGPQKVTIQGRPDVTFLALGTAGPVGPPGSGGIWGYDPGSGSYQLDPDARIYQQLLGQPDPAGLQTHDIVVRES